MPEAPERPDEKPRASGAKRLLQDAAIFLTLAVVSIATWHFVSPRSSPINYVIAPEGWPANPRQPRPTTMDPALFTGRVAEGYRVARERPALLERLPCYCGCYFNSGHQNSLDCFTDKHGETCELCLTIALRAEKLEKEGYAVPDIKKIIDRDYAPRKD